MNTITGKSLALEAETVAEVKAMINASTGVSTEAQRLICAGEQLVDSATLSESMTLNLVVSMRGGGKVHGSLARAGKVKNSTPKVPKTAEAGKQLTGRARKRMLYNRRFVNVAASTGGRRVGPNNNAARLELEALKAEQEAAKAAAE